MQPNKKLIELLGEVDMLKDFTDEERQDLAACLEEASFKANEIIFREGDPGGKMFIVAEGMVEIQKRRSHGTGRVVISRFDRGGVIGEMSVIDGMPRSATVVAVQPTKMFVLSQEGFEDMIANNHELAIKLLKGLAKLLSLRLRNTSGWFADVF